MEATKTKTDLSRVIEFLSTSSYGRATRLGVLEPGYGVVIDYWLEDGLPLEGLDVDDHDSEEPSIQILLGHRGGTDKSHFTHRVSGVSMLKIEIAGNGETEGIDILDKSGATTTLRFEKN